MSESHQSSDLLQSSQRLKGVVNYAFQQNDVRDILKAKALLETILPSWIEPKIKIAELAAAAITRLSDKS
jgi:hypothetical protein